MLAPDILIVFNGGTGRGQFITINGTVSAGQKVTNLVQLNGPGPNAPNPFSDYLVTLGNFISLVQEDTADLSGSTFLAVITGVSAN